MKGRGAANRASRASGCPDLNWGPLRPERSALPGCATPREGDRLAQERLDSVRARVGPLADQEVAAVRDHPQRRAQAPRVFEGVLGGDLAVAGAPETEDGAGDPVQVAARVLPHERGGRREDVRVEGGP